MDHYSFHEVWWIHSDRKASWAGLRIAHFRKASDGTPVVIITGEPPDRNGIRIWHNIAAREGWVQVQQIPIPTPAEVAEAVRVGRGN